MTDKKQIQNRARRKLSKIQAEREKPYFRRAIAWLKFAGLLDTKDYAARKEKLSLDDLLKAGEIEPRVNELLPAIMRELEFAVSINKAVPEDLADVLNEIDNNKAKSAFRGIPAKGYTQWIGSSTFERAKRRLSGKGKPRQKMLEQHSGGSEDFGSVLRKARVERGFTQVHFAEEFGVSLRALRDLEQGKESVSLARLKDIARELGYRLELEQVGKSVSHKA